MPPSKSPPGVGNHPSSEGTYAKPDPTASNAKSLAILPVTFAATVLLSFCLYAHVIIYTFFYDTIL